VVAARQGMWAEQCGLWLFGFEGKGGNPSMNLEIIKNMSRTDHKQNSFMPRPRTAYFIFLYIKSLVCSKYLPPLVSDHASVMVLGAMLMAYCEGFNEMLVMLNPMWP